MAVQSLLREISLGPGHMAATWMSWAQDGQLGQRNQEVTQKVPPRDPMLLRLKSSRDKRVKTASSSSRGRAVTEVSR